MQLSLLRQGDWPGIATLAIGLAAFQTVLEEGNKDDWFGSPFIVRLAVVAAVSLALFFWIEFTTPRPLLNLRLLKRRNFGLGSLANVILGMALYGSVYLLPVYLSQSQGYNSEQVGMVLAWTGLPQLVLIPCVPFLMKRIDTRVLVGIGFALFAASCFMNLGISPDYSGDQLFLPNIVRAIGQALVLTPLSALATGGIERENAGSASAMFNMMRNLGGSVGIAALETFVTKREQFHSNVISSQVSLLDAAIGSPPCRPISCRTASATPRPPGTRRSCRSAARSARNPTCWPTATPSTSWAWLCCWPSQPPSPCARQAGAAPGRIDRLPATRATRQRKAQSPP
jgi:DHA2 family multidrug resistance protein